MKVNSVNFYGNLSRRHVVSQQNPAAVQSNSTSSRPKLYQVSFGDRYIHQILEYTPECNGTGLGEMKIGGEGVVGFELGESLIKHEKINGRPVDDRRIMPIWNHANQNGGHKFIIHRGMNRKEFIAQKDISKGWPAKFFMSAKPGQTKEEIAKALNITPDEIDYVVQSKPNGQGPDALSRFCIIEPTSAKGTVKAPRSSQLGEMDEVFYQFMKISEDNPSYVGFTKKSNNYFLYTHELAKTRQPYSYGPNGVGSFDAEIINSNGMRAIVESIFAKNQMNTEEFGYFKPASFIAHDRPASTFMVHLANLSSQGNTEVNGVKAHKVEHNPSFDYQGRTYDPFKMINVVASEKEINELKSNPNFPILQKAQKYGIDSKELTDKEKQIAKAIIEPFVAPYKDYFGAYNITKASIASVRKNPENFSLGSVSWNFDSEMKSPETPDAAKGLTGEYASLVTKPVANGVTVANMRFDERDVQFGKGGNGLSLPENTKNFTPFKYDGTNIKEVLEAKKKNAQWLTNLIWDASQKGPDELKKLMFNASEIAEGSEVMGTLSPIKEGEMLFLGLGRADTQKCYPISTGSVLHFFKRDDVPKEQKLKAKFLFGIGLMDKNHPHYKMVAKDLKDISELDGGAYKNNILVNRGFTANRLNACAQFGEYTSLYEMFGITPIESKAAGSPSLLTKTGGFRDYTKDGVNGFITKDVVMGKPEAYGLTYNNTPQEIEMARINRQIPQMSDNIKRAVDLYINHQDDYVEMCKKNLEEKVDWHNNTQYNKGMSANQRYKDVIFEANKGWDGRNKKPMKSINGEFGKWKEPLESLRHQMKSKPAKIILGAIITVATVGSATYLYFINKKHKQAKTQKQLDNVA